LEDVKHEAALHKEAIKLQEVALIATVYDGSPEQQNYQEAKNTRFPICWGVMWIEFNKMEQKKFGRSFL
jgi:hypothetical protein